MPLNLCDFQDLTQEAVKAFWKQVGATGQEQVDSGEADGSRGARASDPHKMCGFVNLMRCVIEANGLKNATISLGKSLPALSGFFCPTKPWDMLVHHQERLIAALELTSHTGSLENKFKNRAQEALGTAHDFWTAYREGGLGEDAPKPFLGWLILAEDAPGSRTPVTDRSPHFPLREEFAQASYATRYDLLCKKLVRENLYTASCLLLSPQTAVKTGKYTELSELSNLETFVSGLASHVAAEAVTAKRA